MTKPPRSRPDPAVALAARDSPPSSRPETPAYTVRESPRARRVTLRMSAERGLEVVVPRGFRRAHVPGIVREKAAWIARMETRMAPERARLAAEPPHSLPERIDLRAVGETWLVEYRETASSRVTVREHGAFAESEDEGGAGPWYGATDSPGGALVAPTGLLRVSGAVGDPAACRAALRRWVARRATAVLAPLLEAVALEEGLPFSSVAVRGQRTRWGSCSRRGAINLNRHLLFLDPKVVRYVLVHELCHTVRPDHSRRFWDEVLCRAPDAPRLRRELRGAGSQVPAWARNPKGPS